MPVRDGIECPASKMCRVAAVRPTRLQIAVITDTLLAKSSPMALTHTFL